MTGHSRHTANAFASTFYFFADTQINAKKIKRACKPTHGGQCKLDTTVLRPEKTTTHNSGFKKLAVQWLNQVQFSNQTFVVADSFVLRNRQLLKPAKRYQSA